jgi:hypothetical protein
MLTTGMDKRRRQAGRHLEDVGQTGLAVQRAGVRGLDHRTVGDRIAVGDAEFAQRTAARLEFPQDGGREVQIGISGRHEGHQRLAALGAKLLE